jgi:hypothetical protein
MYVQNKNTIKQCICKPKITAKRKELLATASGPEICKTCTTGANKNKRFP